ncbi:MAG: exo-alpha-sialidase [Clostridia bacterium]|nr:exo-alpha-sialidase [Clostridia bacterium]
MGFLSLAGREVCVLPTHSENMRNSEGSFFRLKDNSIIYVWSHYYEMCDDCDLADFGCIRSYDEGMTWVERRIMYGDGHENLMDPTLFRLKNGDVGMVYVRHDRCGTWEERSNSNIYHKGMLYFTKSSDECQTWSEPKLITPEDEGFCFVNGHGTRLKSGRILIPVANHRFDPSCYYGLSIYGIIAFFYSDDDGETWHEAPQRVYGLPEEITATGLQEPFPYQTETGRIRVFCRTDLGVQYETYSDDDGLTWSPAVPNKHFTSPCSPMVMLRTGKYTVAVLNPIPHYLTRVENSSYTGGDDRDPFILDISEDDGKTFIRQKMLDPRVGVQYPAVFDGGDYFLVGYEVILEGVIARVRHDELK